MEEYLSSQHMLPVLVCNQTPYRLNVNRESYAKLDLADNYLYLVQPSTAVILNVIFLWMESMSSNLI